MTKNNKKGENPTNGQETEDITISEEMLSLVQEDFLKFHLEALQKVVDAHNETVAELENSVKAFEAEVESVIESNVHVAVEEQMTKFIASHKEELQKLEDFEVMKKSYESIKVALESLGVYVDSGDKAIVTLRNENANLTSAKETLEKTLSDTKAELLNMRRDTIIAKCCEGLTSSDKERVKALLTLTTCDENNLPAFEMVVKKVVENANKQASKPLDKPVEEGVKPTLTKAKTKQALPSWETFNTFK